MGMKMSRVGPMGGYSLAKLSAQKGIQKAVKRVRELLEKQSRNEVEELLLKAVRWSGRATVSERHEESFLLYAIALECIVLPGMDGGELGYRLSQRVARLIGGDMRDREMLQKKTKELYGIRSKIVHSGFYEINEDDLNGMRTIAKTVVLRLLADAEVQGFASAKHLSNWYERQMLK